MAAANRMASFLGTMKWEGGDKLSLVGSDPGNWTGGKVGVGALKGTIWGVWAAVAAANHMTPRRAHEGRSAAPLHRQILVADQVGFASGRP